MSHRVCPWWLGWALASPLRRLVQDPAAIMAPFLRSGMTVLEPGPGMGFFTLEAARRVAPTGRVVAVDLQPQMLAGLRRKVERAGLTRYVEARQAAPDSLAVGDLAGKVDVVLAFALVHELPDAGRFFAEVRRALAPQGRVLLAEPTGHVSAADFEATLEAARREGLLSEPGPAVWRSRTAVLSQAPRPDRPAVGAATR
jgi:ubiquinone/menaquinone biosynthesis C-methylase UbiE